MRSVCRVDPRAEPRPRFRYPADSRSRRTRPLRRALGRLPEWPKGAVCKTVGSAYVGSNPTPATQQNPRSKAFCGRAWPRFRIVRHLMTHPAGPLLICAGQRVWAAPETEASAAALGEYAEKLPEPARNAGGQLADLRSRAAGRPSWPENGPGLRERCTAPPSLDLAASGSPFPGKPYSRNSNMVLGGTVLLAPAWAMPAAVASRSRTVSIACGDFARLDPAITWDRAVDDRPDAVLHVRGAGLRVDPSHRGGGRCGEPGRKPSPLPGP
jgi:hypothetical protein